MSNEHFWNYLDSLGNIQWIAVLHEQEERELLQHLERIGWEKA